MKVVREDISSVKKVLHIELPADYVAEVYSGAVKDLAKKANIAGFRKGKVPEEVVKQKYSDELLGELATRAIEMSIPAALKGEGLVPVARPNFEVITLAEEGPFRYTAEVEVRPDIEIENYHNLGIEKRPFEVEEGDVDEALERLRDGRAEFKAVDRAAEDGDMAMLDFVCSVDGEPVEDGSAKDYPVVIGDTLLPGFDEVLTGAKAGDELSLDTTFPEKYREKSLAGKEGHFEITVKNIRERVVPPLDNAFAKMFGLKTMAELREKFTEELAENKKRQERDRQKNEAMDKLIKENHFEVPPSIVERYYSGVIKAADSLNEKGEKVERTREVEEKYREIAAHHARRDMILEHLAEKEKVTVSDAEIGVAADNMAKARGEDPDRVVARLQREGSFEMFKHGLRDEKVFDILLGTRGEETSGAVPAEAGKEEK